MKIVNTVLTTTLLTLAPLSVSLANGVNVQNIDFAHSGPYVQGELVSMRPTSNFNYDGTSSGSKHAKILAGGSIGLGYEYIQNLWSLGVNATYTFIHNRSIDLPAFPVKNVTFDNIFNLNFEPGYYFSPSALGYLKFGFAYTNTGYTLPDGTTHDLDSIFEYTHGYTYGLGFKNGLDEHVFVGAELSQTQFENTSRSSLDASFSKHNASNKLRITQFAIQIGYKF